MAGQRANSVAHVFATPGAQHDGADEGRPTANAVYERGTGEVVEAHRVQPAAAPFPGADPGVDQAHVQHREDHERAQLDAFGHGAGNDSGRSCREHGLKQKVRPIRVAYVVSLRDARVVGAQPEAREAQKAVEVARVHQVKADVGVADNPEADDEGILEQDVDGVFLLRQPAFQRGETQVHDEDQAGAEHHPQIVGGENAHGHAFIGGRRCWRCFGGHSFSGRRCGYGVLGQGRCRREGDRERDEEQQGWKPFRSA